MITSMKSTHGSVPFKHSVVRLYTATCAKYNIGSVNMGNNRCRTSTYGKLYLWDRSWTDLYETALGPVHKVKPIIMSFNFSSSQLARMSLAEFVSKLILIELDFVCEPGQKPGGRVRCTECINLQGALIGSLVRFICSECVI